MPTQPHSPVHPLRQPVPPQEDGTEPQARIGPPARTLPPPEESGAPPMPSQPSNGKQLTTTNKMVTTFWLWRKVHLGGAHEGKILWTCHSFQR